MKPVLPWLAVLLVAAAVSPRAQAQYGYPCPPAQVAPDMCGPGYYCANCCGLVYGPNYCVRPPFPPFNGMLAVPKMPAKAAPGVPTMPGAPASYAAPAGVPTFPTHPFARSPRDYFMVYDPY